MRDELIATENGEWSEEWFIVFGPGPEQDVKLLPCWYAGVVLSKTLNCSHVGCKRGPEQDFILLTCSRVSEHPREIQEKFVCACLFPTRQGHLSFQLFFVLRWIERVIRMRSASHGLRSWRLDSVDVCHTWTV